MKNLSKLLILGTCTIALSGCFDEDDDQIEVNSPPEAGSVSLITQTETDINDQLTANDADGDNLVFAVVEEPQLGQLTLQSDGNFTYTPNAEITGTDSFVFSVTDDSSAPVSGTVDITIELLEVSFRSQSRLAFQQMNMDLPLSVNGRVFIQDVTEQNEYQDLIDAN